MSEIQNAVDAVQEVAAEVSPAPVEFNNITSAADIKARLDWGEPAFTIIDIRDRQSYNEKRIAGAIPGASEEELSRVRQTLEKNRDIYIYGSSDNEAKRTALQLVESGFERVSIIAGGLSAWDTASGLTEGRDAAPDKLRPGFVNNITE
ncbi:MAG: rhodanese-like domain-containing protein [Cyanobacteria bacterium J06636_16]